MNHSLRKGMRVKNAMPLILGSPPVEKMRGKVRGVCVGFESHQCKTVGSEDRILILVKVLIDGEKKTGSYYLHFWKAA